MSRAALVISVLALIGSFAGTAVGARLLTGKDIRDRSIANRDLRTGAVTGRVAENLTGRDIQRDSLDGSDIAEETLDVRRARTAERADTAGSADAFPGGIRVVRIGYAGQANSSAVALDLGGLTLRASCSLTSALTLQAATANGPAWIRSGGQRQGGNAPVAVYAEDDEFRTGEAFDVLAGAPDNISVRVTYVAPGGSVVTADIAGEQGVPASRGYGCLVAGTATLAPA